MTARLTLKPLRALAGTLLLATPLLAGAASPPMPPPPGMGPPSMEAGCGHWGSGHGGGFGHGAGFGMHHEIARLGLTEDQQDKVFAIMHASEPAFHEQMKALRKAHEALRGVGMSDKYDEARVKAQVDAAAKAEAQLHLLRLHTEHEIYGVLTPEQRAKLAERHEHWQRHHEDGERPHG